ncbi:hypothetical protein GCM10007874_64360 [Labrys miyagiensis]|uniref:Peptidase S54 rhomboid domain-containing protein n=1 Tax=Labrys miyagiensis TaxID=346912 RepID=A0ABQ6CUE2_9HYPH|nr:rhomboid family intramembrane serine protease [Labrys miyagiensis]GLS23415.1 hypothetical protein GCM10007874_64360 [Labrys miyagiensis]
MDLQIFLALSAASFAAVVIGQMVITESHRVPGTGRMFALLSLVILVAVAGYWLLPGVYGYLTVLALALVYAPGLLMLKAQRETIAGRSISAARLSGLAVLLHPDRTTRYTAALFSAVARPTPQERVEALTAMRSTVAGPEALMLELQILRQQGDWPGMVDFLRSHSVPLVGDAVLFPIRALGETGQLDALVQTYAAHRTTLGRSHVPLMIMLAFCGRVDAVAALLPTLSILPPVVKAFWHATALQAAGRFDEARRLLETFDPAALTDIQREMIAARLKRPVVEAAPLLSPAAAQQLDMMAMRAGRDAPLRQADWRRTPLTYLLILANCVMFGVEMFVGDSQDTQTLYDLGALWPPDVIHDQQWWRLVSAMFLHAGPEHLISNMFALWVLGRFVEIGMGTWRMAVIYGVGGLISMAGVVGLTAAGLTEPNLLVGASGAIFALLGAIALQRLTDFLATRTVADRRNLSMVGLVLVLQAGIDLALPQISFTAHLIGLLAGIALGWILKRR